MAETTPKPSASDEVRQIQHKLMRLATRRPAYLTNVVLAGLVHLIFHAESEAVRLSALRTLLATEPVEGRLRAMNAAAERRKVAATPMDPLEAKLLEMFQTGHAEQALRAIEEELRLANGQAPLAGES